MPTSKSQTPAGHTSPPQELEVGAHRAQYHLVFHTQTVINMRPKMEGENIFFGTNANNGQK